MFKSSNETSESANAKGSPRSSNFSQGFGIMVCGREKVGISRCSGRELTRIEESENEVTISLEGTTSLEDMTSSALDSDETGSTACIRAGRPVLSLLGASFS